ncbi:type II secretion system protein GspL [Vibrio diazotrophicus]|uniref:Type II secretion system protein L n=1 Tax=Vibrio diazotrophicus TaxID=685 RepID=A0A329EK90_VIBDI|nr:type II secretion system protein GspL [Vibrio diazotrophicus]PNI02801.1 type II secretion system protein GspL [Vibrio diazotrophicus]RAS67693.1 type II secretion system protein L (GspL) [Vibrio diazotrophicus]
MSEFLTVRLSSQKEAIIRWLVWSSVQQEVIASGEISGWEQLEQLSSYAEQRSIIVLMSASDVVLSQVEIPAGANRKIESMLPYLIEDEVAQDVDDMHFSILKKTGNIVEVAGIDRDFLQSCIDELASLGMTVKRVIPDVLTVPVQQGLAAVQLGKEWLIRKGDSQGICVDSEWLELFSQSDWVKEGDNFLPLTAYTPLPELGLADGQDWHFTPSPLVMQLLTEQALQSKVNMLTGSFRVKSSSMKYWRIWRKAAYAALVFLTVLIGYKLLETHRLEQQVQAYRAESERIFRVVFPEREKIPTVSYLKRLMNDELNALQGGSAQGSVLQWLTPLPATLRSIQGMELQSIKFDSNRGEVRLETTSKDFQSFEQARVKLAEQFVVEQGQVNKNGDVVAGSFVLKQK